MPHRSFDQFYRPQIKANEPLGTSRCYVCVCVCVCVHVCVFEQPQRSQQQTTAISPHSTGCKSPFPVNTQLPRNLIQRPPNLHPTLYGPQEWAPRAFLHTVYREVRRAHFIATPSTYTQGRGEYPSLPASGGWGSESEQVLGARGRDGAAV